MIVYHKSTETIQNPDVVYSKNYLDFRRRMNTLFLCEKDVSTSATDAVMMPADRNLSAAFFLQIYNIYGILKT